MDIQEIVERIKRIDIQQISEKLRNIDLKSLREMDADEIKGLILARLDLVINTLLILITLIVVLNAHGGYSKKAEALKWEISQAKGRLEAIEESDRVRKEYAELRSNFPEAILTDQIISKLSEFAASRNVQILSFSPAQEKSDEYIIVAAVRINISSDRYENIVFFVKDIEDAPYTMRVERFSALMRETSSGDDKEYKEAAVKRSIEAEVEIGSVKIKDE